MARRYWSINIPRFKAGTLVELAKIIYSRHKDDGEESILGVFDMEKFDQDATEAEILRKKALALKRESEELMQSSRKLLGIDKEQSSFSQGTVLNVILRVRDLLIAMYKGSEEKLGAWGFDVIVAMGKQKTGKKKINNEGMKE